jgi:hypothetical protein
MLKKIFTFFLFFFGEKKEGGGRDTEKETEREERGLLGSYCGAPAAPRGQFYFGNMFLSGRGQHLLPLFSIIQNKY